MSPHLVVRRLGAADHQLVQSFVRRLSPDTRRQRFMAGVSELSPAMLSMLTGSTGSSLTLAAVAIDDGTEHMVGEASYAPSTDVHAASEIALVVADDFQRQGIGRALLEQLLHEAAAAGVERVHADVLRDNTAMLRLARKLGFVARPHPHGATMARLERVLAAGALQAFRSRKEQQAFRSITGRMAS